MATPHVLNWSRRRNAAAGCEERGAASVEFVLLFPAMFLILYAIVTYGLIFGAQHTMALAAAEGGRAALRYQNAADIAQALTRRKDAARQAAEQPLAWLQSIAGPHLQSVVTSVECADNTALTCVTVRVAYDYRAAPLVPSLLPVPAALSSESVVQLSPQQLL